ncbi:hypothetical protein AB0K40_08075 [Nonomuraea bangladeshensis]|uniref:RICIN domain-containing protein n=1 Tax=Nonomuraea bangladeshensis TaxID=404385 RepID=A0ABV3GZH1_9ACTN
MFPRLALVAAAFIVILAPSPAVAQPADGWHEQNHWGSVTVSADRKHITVCDLSNDGLSVRAEYATTYLQTWTVEDTNGPRPGCGTGSTFFSRITAFKLCRFRPFETCLPSVRTSRSTLS